jgi:outer membrane receptor for ferric coprogen and ferric-rhodotorulic acid
LSELFKGDTQLNVIFDSYDYYSSKHHEAKVKEILANPIQWAIVNSRDSNWKNMEEEQEFATFQLDQIFENPFSSELAISHQKKESDFSGIINISGFNPVAAYRKHQGDYYYIHVKTLEETDLHVTASA